MIIYPYKRGLRSTALLRDAGCKVRYGTSTPAPDLAMAWGCRTMPVWGHRVTWINNPLALPLCTNKLNFAKLMDQHDIGPDSTTEIHIAKIWAGIEGTMVVCRTTLTSSRGRGIVIARTPDEVVPAPLYTVYFKKQREYRIIHGPACGTIYVATKRRTSRTSDDRDASLVRTGRHGWVYQVEPSAPLAVLDTVQRTGKVLQKYGLNLLAYDVAYNTHNNQACMIEANTAPGLNRDSASLVLEAMIKIGETL